MPKRQPRIRGLTQTGLKYNPRAKKGEATFGAYGRDAKGRKVTFMKGIGTTFGFRRIK